MRLFIAVPLAGAARELALGAQSAYRRRNVRGNYTSPENLHITLAFIGEFGDPDRVLEALEAVSFAPFTLTMDRLGSFESLLWAGFADSPALEELARKVRRALAEADVPFDRKRFRAHVTLLRKPEFPAGKPVSVDMGSAEMAVDRFCLMLSTRGRSGMIYTELGAVPAQTER